ncbi:FtsX-like permease family protein [Tessaracoccus lapidicaptus]|uniref:FtsX-like permease family protein n=1 Tax=Tessaracoccus lapidicaptus TaxID=1427523 RepID=UPI0033407B34
MTPLSWIVSRLRAGLMPVVAVAVAVAVTVALIAALPRVVADLAGRATSGAFATLSAREGDLMARWRGAPAATATTTDPSAAYLEAAEDLRQAQPRPLRDVLVPPQLLGELGFPLSVTPPASSGYHRLTFAVLVDATLEEHTRLVSGAWPRPPDAGDPVTEAVVLHDAAERLGWVLGSEPLPGIRLAGTFRPTERHDRRWEQVPRGVRYAELVDPNLGTELVSAVFVDDRALAVGVSGKRPQIIHTLWYGIRADTESAGLDAEVLAAQLTATLARTHDLTTDGRLSIRLFSELGDVLGAVSVQQRTLTALVLAMAAGPVGLSILLVWLAAVGVGARRAAVTALVLARGASPGQLRAWALTEGVAVLLVGGFAGYAVVDAAVPGPGPVAGVGSLSGSDALAAVAPTLLTVAGGIVVWRLRQVVLRLLVGPLRTRRSLPGLLGVLRALRGSGGALPLIAVLLGVSVAVVGGTLSASLDATARDAAWGLNGAPVRIAGPRMTDDVVARIESVDGVASVARVARVADAVPLQLPEQTIHVGVWAADGHLLDAYRGSPVDPDLPPALFGSADGVAAVVGGLVPQGATGGRLGSVGQVRLLGHRDLLPGIATPDAWALVSSDAWASAGGEAPTATIALVALADGARADEVASALRIQLDTAVVSTAEEQLRGRHVPASLAFTRLATATGLVTLVLMTGAILAADAVGAAARRHATARLRALGAPDRDIRLSVVWETAPGLLFAVASGIGLGLGAAALLLGWLDYGFITGARRARLALDPAWLAAVLGLVLVALAAVITTAARRAAGEGEAP